MNWKKILAITSLIVLAATFGIASRYVVLDVDTLNVHTAATSSGDITINAHSTGNAAATNALVGLPQVKFVALGTMTNASTENIEYTDDTPDGEWTAVDASCVVSADTTYYRVGSKSLKLAFAAGAAADDGATTDITNDNLEANEFVSMWVYSTANLAAGDVNLFVDDTTVDTDFDFPAITAGVWTWVDIDISALTGGSGDVVDKIGITLSTAGAASLGAFDLYVDLMYKWDQDNDENLGVNLVTDGVLGLMTIATASGTANTPAIATYGTNYFVYYGSSTDDCIVGIGDNSANSGVALVAYQ